MTVPTDAIANSPANPSSGAPADGGWKVVAGNYADGAFEVGSGVEKFCKFLNASVKLVDEVSGESIPPWLFVVSEISKEFCNIFEVVKYVQKARHWVRVDPRSKKMQVRYKNVEFAKTVTKIVLFALRFFYEIPQVRQGLGYLLDQAEPYVPFLAKLRFIPYKLFLTGIDLVFHCFSLHSHICKLGKLHQKQKKAWERRDDWLLYSEVMNKNTLQETLHLLAHYRNKRIALEGIPPGQRTPLEAKRIQRWEKYEQVIRAGKSHSLIDYKITKWKAKAERLTPHLAEKWIEVALTIIKISLCIFSFICFGFGLGSATIALILISIDFFQHTVKLGTYLYKHGATALAPPVLEAIP